MRPMMNPLRELKLNQPGRIEPLGTAEAGGLASRGFDGTVREVSSERIVLELRDEPPHTPRFEVGQRVALQYWDVFGLHRGVTEVTRVSPTRPNELAIAPPETVELTQKRKFFRVHVSVPVRLTLADGRVLETHTDDLTPAGMRVTSPQILAPGDEARARIDFARATAEPTEPVYTAARVVRAAAVPHGWTTSLVFPSIPETEQVRISLLLFALQRRVS